MAMVKSTMYAPDIFKSLNGILLIYKPPRLSSREFLKELRESISDSLNQYQPRPISRRLLIEGSVDAEKSIVEVPNLADHPLVSGPRYAPWELKMSFVKPILGYRSSGLSAILLGTANRYYRNKLNRTRLVNVYHITGRFGFVTDTFFYDGKITDKATFKHIRSGRMDSVLSKIESIQNERLFDSAAVPRDSQEAYELAKAWPSRPPQMAEWPVIYRIRCIHLKLPEFKIEVTVTNENEQFLAQLSHDIGQMLKSAAYTESIRRVKLGPFDVNDSIIEKEWDLQSIINNLSLYNRSYKELHEILNSYKKAMRITTEHSPDYALKGTHRGGLARRDSTIYS